MSQITIKEETVLNILNSVLSEETKKVHRNDYNKVQFKMDEFEIQLNETIKELRKLEDSVPDGLRNLTLSKISNISDNLSNAQTKLRILKSKIKEHKKNSYKQNSDEIK
jgi:hypothetical protein